MRCRVKEKRIMMGKSQSDLAKATGCTRAQISKIENNKIPNPGVKIAIKIAKELYTAVENLWY